MSKNHNLTLAGPDLAALLCSRVCHDIISPVGAINNGLELLDEGGADADAMDLIRTSALNASVRLKFARLAFGASGSVGASIDTGEAEKAVIDYVSADKKTEVTWSGPRAIIPKNQVKLLLVGIAQHVAAAPDGFDVVLCRRWLLQLLAQLADEDVDDLQFRLVHAAIEMVEEHFLGQRRALAQRKQLEHLVFLAGQVHALAVDFDRLGVEIDLEIAGLMTDCAWPLERRTIAWMRATSSSLWNGLVM
jgi:hypothetical protein